MFSSSTAFSNVCETAGICPLIVFQKTAFSVTAVPAVAILGLIFSEHANMRILEACRAASLRCALISEAAHLYQAIFHKTLGTAMHELNAATYSLTWLKIFQAI